MGHCNLGIDKTGRLKRFNDWLKGAQAKIDFMGLTTDKQKISLLRSWAGPELLTYWEREVGIRFESTPRVEAAGGRDAIPAQEAHTYQDMLRDTRQEILKHVNRDRSLIDLLNMRQTSESWMAFIHDLEEAADLCQLETKPFTRDDAIRVAALAGMKDRNLAEKALAEKYSLTTLISTGSTRETSRATADALQGRGATSSVSRVDRQEIGDSDMSEEELDRAIADLTIRKLKKSGKYSVRKKDAPSKTKASNILSEDKAERCRYCNTRHEPHRCPAKGKECFQCEGADHFANTPACTFKRGTTRRLVEEEREEEVEDDPSDTESHTVHRVHRVGRIEVWGSSSRAQDRGGADSIKQVGSNKGTNKWVTITMGDRKMNLFSDTGSRYTIIPPEFYHHNMGKLLKSDTTLRAWGSKYSPDVRGKFHTTLVTKKGARKDTWVYVVAGYRPEALLGDVDAEDLGIISFHRQGRDPTEKELQLRDKQRKVNPIKKLTGSEEGRETSSSETIPLTSAVKPGSIAEKIRNRLGVIVVTNRPPPEPIPAKEFAKVLQLVEEFTGTVFTDKIGCMKTSPVVLDFDPKFKPTQPPYRPIPIHYRDKISSHLQKLRDEGIITNVDPRKSYPCVMNTVITEKATPGEVRMNIDSTPQNPGMRRTKFHVKTPHEIRHDLEGATVFSECDMGFGFHQVELDKSSKERSIFQTHEGLHRMERLYFGPTSSSGIFHNEVSKALRGIKGCTTIHDNILIGGRDYEDHMNNLRATLQRCNEKGITLKLSKSNFCRREVIWFGRIFSATGVSADPEKITRIIEAGRPNTTEEVRSLIQAAAYNARFMFDHKEGATYEETTAPLRELMVKGAVFS